MILSGSARDAERQQVLAGWQHIADGLIQIKATAREIRAVRSLLSSRLAPVADILGIHNCVEARGVLRSGGTVARRSKNRMDGVGYLHLRGKNPPIWYVNFTVEVLSPEGAVIRQRVRKRIGPVTELTEQQARARKNEILVSEGATAISTGARLVSPTVAEFVVQRFMVEHVALAKEGRAAALRNILKESRSARHRAAQAEGREPRRYSAPDPPQTECETAADSLKGGGA